MIEKHDVPPELEVRTSASHADGSVALDAEALASVGVPVTIISGFQNVGKTTFLQYLVNVYTSDPTRRVGIVLNHQSESSAENSASVGAFAWLRGQPNVVVVDILGSIWSTARDVFIEELNGLAARENLHYIFVEASSTTDLLPLAQVFMSPSMNPRGRSLHGVCTLDTTVCVVDASDFLHKYYGTETLKMIGMNTSESVS
jgi:G3E family GTPase